MSQLVVALPLHCVRYLHMPESRVGVLFSINGVIVVLLQFWASKGLERSRLTSGLTLGCLLYGMGYLGVGFSPGFETAALAVFVLTLGEILVQPGQHTLAANIAPESHKGRYLGVHGILQQVGASFGILLGGAGNEYLAPLWPPLPWCLVACVALAAGLCFRSLGSRVTTEQDGKIPAAPLQELPVILRPVAHPAAPGPGPRWDKTSCGEHRKAWQDCELAASAPRLFGSSDGRIAVAVLWGAFPTRISPLPNRPGSARKCKINASCWLGGAPSSP